MELGHVGEFLTIEDAIKFHENGGMTIHDADNTTITIGEEE